MASHMQPQACEDGCCECEEPCGFSASLLTPDEAGHPDLDADCWFFAVVVIKQDCQVVYVNGQEGEDISGLADIIQARLTAPDGYIHYEGPVSGLEQKWIARIAGLYTLHVWVPGGYDYGNCGSAKTVTLETGTDCPCSPSCATKAWQHYRVVGLSGYIDVEYTDPRPGPRGLGVGYDQMYWVGHNRVLSAAANHTFTQHLYSTIVDGCPRIVGKGEVYYIGQVQTYTWWETTLNGGSSGPEAVGLFDLWGMVGPSAASAAYSSGGIGGTPHITSGHEDDEYLDGGDFSIIYRPTGTWQDYTTIDSIWGGSTAPTVNNSVPGRINPIGYGMQIVFGANLGTAGVPYTGAPLATTLTNPSVGYFPDPHYGFCVKCRSYGPGAFMVSHLIPRCVPSTTYPSGFFSGLWEQGSSGGSINLCLTGNQVSSNGNLRSVATWGEILSGYRDVYTTSSAQGKAIVDYGLEDLCP